MKRNNVTRYLDVHQVSYQVFETPVEKRSAIETAQLLGVPPEKVYKTIVVTRVVKGKPILAVVPGPAEVNLKALARVAGEKKVLLATQREAERLTSLQVGGISPLALLNRGFQVIVDESARISENIYISGGERGMTIFLGTDDLIELTNAILAPIGRK